MNALTDGSQLNNLTDEGLAVWLENEAIKIGENRPGFNNTLSAIRQAAKRLHARPTVDDVAEVLRYHESSGMCHLGEVCDSCDCLSPKLHDDYARTHAAEIVKLYEGKKP